METIILCIHKCNEEQKYPVTLKKWNGSEIAHTTFEKTFAPLSLDEICEEFTKTDAEENAKLAQIGEQLYNLLGQAGIDSYCDPALDPTGSQHRIVLDIQPEELQGLPWELMMRKHYPVFCHAPHPICRGNLMAGMLEEHEWPLRILVVIGSEYDDKDVLAEGEVESIIDALAKVECDVDLRILKRPSKPELMTHFDTAATSAFAPHILHFIGHGGVDENGESYLKLHNDSTNLDNSWYASEILADFRPMPHKPRLVVVNACRSSAFAPRGLRSVTNAFLEAGITAVLGVHTRIKGKIAGSLSAGFYSALAGGDSLDKAVAQARYRIRQELTNANRRREWAAPCLEVQAHPESIIRLGYGIDAEQRQRILSTSDFKCVRQLVDRREDRWDTWHQLIHSQHKVIAIIGDNAVGKTKFAHMIMERCSLCKHTVRYIDLQSNDGVDALTFLRRICNGDGNGSPTRMLSQPLYPEGAFAEFKNTVETILKLPFEKARLTENSPSDVRLLFDKFEQGLTQSIAESPLVLFLDHLGSLPAAHFKEFVTPYFLKWCALRPDRRIVIIMLLTPDEYDRFGISSLQDVGLQLYNIQGFPASEWEELAWEFIRRNFEGTIDENSGPFKLLQGHISLIGQSIEPKWKPEKLGVLEGIGKIHHLQKRGG